MNLRTFYITLGVLSAVVLWSYWSTILLAADRWASDDQYSHGWLVPFFSLYLLWHRRDLIEAHRLRRGETLAPSWWCMPFLLLALVLRYIEVRFFYNGLDSLSMIPMFMGVMLAVGGWPAFRWSWPATVFLVFMVPLPFFLHTAMSTQLQGMATSMSAFTLQTLGLPAVAEGTQIMINESRVSVVEACSGLGMIVTFAALSTAVVLMINSRWWVKAGLLLGAIPVSIICNVVRICTYGVFKYAGYGPETMELIHDIVGWLMILLGIGLIFVELFVLERIVVAQDQGGTDDRPLNLPYGFAAPQSKS